jgi:alkanesulfonate monooxygenase SsuD/methylene tetrahydromethanopterin reductase-like flavin-dependent oxidoreductase (luciferase family)
MEFGIFVQTHLPGHLAHEPVAEHRALLDDLGLIVQADQSSWKYAWVSEHHCLTEYSHLSASESFIPFALARTNRIHVGSGIWPLSPVTNHPIRLAERAAMCDQLSEGRFEFGTGRGAGSWEVGTFNLTNDITKDRWNEVIVEFKEMWSSLDYSHEGTYFSNPGRNILPKPYGGGRTHPAMWVAAGNPATYEKAASMGLGALGFNMSAIHDMKPAVDSYKAAIGNAKPVGRYVNDNVMITNTVVCLPDGNEARKWATKMGLSYIQSLTCLYHDTFPIPEWADRWPNIIPEPTLSDIDERIKLGYILCGNPDEVSEQVERYLEVGCDQVGFGLPIGLPHDIAMETVKTFGEKVIPNFDKDPVHRTTRFRQEAGGGVYEGTELH